MKKIMLASADAGQRHALRQMIEARDGLRVSSEAGEGKFAVRGFLEHQPDLTIMDIDLPGLDGLSALQAIRDKSPEARVLLLGSHSAEETVYRAFNAGADGYALKCSPGPEIAFAMDSILEGRKYISPDIAPVLIRDFLVLRRARLPLQRVQTLTAREREIMRLVAHGLTSKEIAARLFISDKTVDKHRSNLMRKLNIHKSAELREITHCF